MNSPRHSGCGSDGGEPDRIGRAGAVCRQLGGCGLYALIFGALLGLSLLKFGNPVILDRAVAAPTNLYEARIYAWPVLWAYWLLGPLALIGFGLAITMKPRWPGARCLWVLPLIWFGWQVVAATRTEDERLTALALGQFAGCVGCYFLGALVFCRERMLRWLLIGLLVGFAFCLVKAVRQRCFEFPQERQSLVEGERDGWSHYPPEVFQQSKRDGVIITTNGVDVANPVILAKYAKGRVSGTLFYPNSLAGAVLLLWPVSIALAFHCTRHFRTLTRRVLIALTLFLGGGGLFWTGSKLGWLIALGLAGVLLLRMDWPNRWKYAVLAFMVVAGLGVFAVRFHSYFAAGATSLGARFDYWRVASQVTREHPGLGSGPGTFQRPYARLKPPGAEMARLTHNDYLEQFSDSGVIGGISYCVWIGWSLARVGRRLWRGADPVRFAVFAGVLGWFVQGLGEFSLYIPALAWTSFTLLGWLVAAANQIDNSNIPSNLRGE